MAYSKAAAITSRLRAEITGGGFRKGDKLPTEGELSARFGVSRQTVRKALAELGEEGLISSIQGSGSFVEFEAPSRRKTMNITIITSYISEYVFPSILRGIENVVSGAGFTVNIRATNNSIANERKILLDLLENPVDGIAVEGTKTTMPNPNVELYGRLAEQGIPILMFNNYYPGLELPGYPHVISQHERMHTDLAATPMPNIHHVILDDYAGGYALTEKLLKKGHSTIGGIFKSDDMQGFVRFSGYLDCMLYNGADYRDSNVIWYTTESSPTIKRFLNEHMGDAEFLQMFRNCTAVVCYNDQAARFLLTMMEKSSYQGSIRAIYSFDRYWDLDNSQGIETYSLGYPAEKIGSIIGSKLLDMIDGRETSSDMLSWEK